MLFRSGSDTINVTFSLAGVNELSDTDLLLYPNPSNGVFTLTLSQLANAKPEIRLIDLLGHVLYSNELQNQTQSFDFSYLDAGTYYMQLLTPNGIITKTFIITHKY